MHVRCRCLLLVAALLGGPELAIGGAASGAQQPAATGFASVREAADRAITEAPTAGTLPPELAAKDLESYAEFLRWQRQFARVSWEWHLFSTKLLMFAVLGIVLCGLWFTYLQFTKDLKATAPSSPHAPKPAPAPESVQPGAGLAAPTHVESRATTMKFGLGGVEISSQVVGLLVLAFSLAFFYLYVKEVYPIQESHLRKQAEAVVAPAASQSQR